MAYHTYSFLVLGGRGAGLSYKAPAAQSPGWKYNFDSAAAVVEAATWGPGWLGYVAVVKAVVQDQDLPSQCFDLVVASGGLNIKILLRKTSRKTFKKGDTQPN